MSEPGQRSELGAFLAEIRRRRVGRFTIAYAAVAFVVLQLAEIVFPAFGIGEQGLRSLVVGLTLGYLPAVLAAWVFDLTRRGIRRTEDEPGGRPVARRMVVLAFGVAAALVSGAVALYLVRLEVRAPAARTGAPVELAAAYDPGQPIQSLAVLPLIDNSEGGDQEFLAAGTHDAIIAQLSRLDGVRVVSRTTSMRYANTSQSIPEIGQELGVDVVIEGSIARAGDQVRISLNVIHAPTDSHIRTLQFEGNASDIFALQTEVAQEVADEIRASYREALADAGEVPAPAQEAFLLGKYELEQGTALLRSTETRPAALEHFRRAVENLRVAVEGAPGYAAAHAQLAGAEILVAMGDSAYRQTGFANALAHARTALALDSTSIEALDVMNRLGPGRVAAADGSLRPGFPISAPPAPGEIAVDVGALDAMWLTAMSTLGRQVDAGARVAGEAESPEETAAGIAQEARYLMATGSFAEAIQLLEPAVRSAPQAPQIWELLMRSYVASGSTLQAIGVVRRWSESGAPYAPDAASLARLRTAFDAEGRRGYWAWRRDYLEGLRTEGVDIVLTDLAAAYAALGERQRAYELLDQALERQEARLLALPNDPVWDPLRAERRFRDIERRIYVTRAEISRQILSPTDPTTN